MIPKTDIGIKYQPDFLKRPKKSDVDWTEPVWDGVQRGKPLTQEELAASRQRIYDKYGDGSNTGAGYAVCQSYDYLIDKKTTENVVGHYEDQREVCIHKAENTPNPNYNVSYKYNDSPYDAKVYSYDNQLIQSNDDNKTKDK